MASKNTGTAYMGDLNQRLSEKRILMQGNISRQQVGPPLRIVSGEAQETRALLENVIGKEVAKSAQTPTQPASNAGPETVSA